MSVPLTDMRRLVWAALRHMALADLDWRNLQTHWLTSLEGIVVKKAEAEGLRIEHNNEPRLTQRLDAHHLRLVVGELERSGIVVYGTENLTAPTLPSFQISEFGHQCLGADTITPYDPDGYVARLNAITGVLDPIVRVYVEESLQCFRRQLLFACAVTLGGAAEQTLLIAIGALHDAIQDGSRKASFRKRAIEERGLKKRFDAFLAEVRQIKGLPQELAQDLDIKLAGIFSLIREARNDAGHPASGRRMSADDAHGALLLFPGYLDRTGRLIAWFRANPV